MRQSNMCVTPVFKLKDDHFLALYAWDRISEAKMLVKNVFIVLDLLLSKSDIVS